MGQDVRGGAERRDTLHPERVAERTTSRGLYEEAGKWTAEMGSRVGEESLLMLSVITVLTGI